MKMGEEYIKSEELTDWINYWLKMDKEDHPYSKGISIPTCEILDIIKRVPKYRVNFPPEKTTKLDLIEDERGDYFICTHCNNGHYDANFALPFYCPYCGHEFVNRPKYGVETY